MHLSKNRYTRGPHGRTHKSKSSSKQSLPHFGFRKFVFRVIHLKKQLAFAHVRKNVERAEEIEEELRKVLKRTKKHKKYLNQATLEEWYVFLIELDHDKKSTADNIRQSKQSLDRKNSRHYKKNVLPVECELASAEFRGDTELSAQLTEQLKKRRKRGNGSYKKYLRRIAHQEWMQHCEDEHFVAELEKQRNKQKYQLKKSPEILQTVKVVDLEKCAQKKEHREERRRNRDLRKIIDFYERNKTDQIPMFLALLTDLGVKEIPTNLFFDPSRSFVDVVVELVRERANVDSVPVQKYIKLVSG